MANFSNYNEYYAPKNDNNVKKEKRVPLLIYENNLYSLFKAVDGIKLRKGEEFLKELLDIT
jgi:hypothetical protein